jgi:Tol biopolymer transport system component
MSTPITFGGDRAGVLNLPPFPSSNAYVWDISESDYLLIDAGSHQYGRGLTLSGDGKYLALVDQQTAKLIRIDIDHGTAEEVALDPESIENDVAAVNGNGQLVLVKTRPRDAAQEYRLRLSLFDWDARTFENVSVTNGGGEIAGDIYSGDLSDNGRFVTFVSPANGIVAGDEDQAPDVFLLDRTTHEVSKVNFSLFAGVDDSAYASTISGDGRYVAYNTYDKMVEADVNGDEDIYVYDRISARTALASVTNSGEVGNKLSRFPTLSEDGRVVAFESSSSNLSPADPDMQTDIYAHIFADTDGDGVWDPFDVCPALGSSGGAEAVDSDGDGVGDPCDNCPSVVNAGQANLDGDADGDACDVDDDNDGVVDVSDNCIRMANPEQEEGDGDGVGDVCDNCAFSSNADQLDSDFDGTGDACSTVTTVERVSVSSADLEAHGWSTQPLISPDGRFVAFNSNAPDLVPEAVDDCPPDFFGSASCYDLFLRDRLNGSTTMLRVAAGDQEANASVYLADMTPDARFFLFYTDASNILASNQAAAFPPPPHVYIFDRNNGSVEQVDVGSQASNSASYTGRMSDDGRLVAFSTTARLEPGDVDSVSDIYLRDRQSHTTELLTGGDTQQTPVYGTGELISGDGTVVVFSGGLSDHGLPAEGFVPGVIVRDIASHVNSALPLPAGATEIVQASLDSFSEDGRYVVLLADTREHGQFVKALWVYDRVSETMEVISKNSLGELANVVEPTEAQLDFNGATISSDNRFVAFETNAMNLSAADGDSCWDIFVHDRQTNLTRRVTPEPTVGRIADGPFAVANSGLVAFSSWARNIVTGDHNGYPDVFVATLGGAPPAPASPGLADRCGPKSGDFDCDNAITGKDVLAALQSFSGFLHPAECMFMTGVGCFGEVNPGVALYMLRYIVGEVSDLDCHAK